MALDTQFADPI